MGLFETTSLLRKRLSSTCPDGSSSPPPSPQENPSTTYQKHLPSRLPSPIHCPRDRSHECPPSTNQLHGPHRGFVSGVNKSLYVNVIKNTHLKDISYFDPNPPPPHPTPPPLLFDRHSPVWHVTTIKEWEDKKRGLTHWKKCQEDEEERLTRRTGKKRCITFQEHNLCVILYMIKFRHHS